MAYIAPRSLEESDTRRRRYSRQDGQPKGDGATENKESHSVMLSSSTHESWPW